MHGNLTTTTPEEANMDFVPTKEREIVIDIDRFISTSREVVSPSLACEKMGTVACSMPDSVDEAIRIENPGNQKTVDVVSPGKSSKREKGKPVKKSPKPPRPPRGLLLLDAADQKLIKEISELAMIKRARIERMKALRKMRAAKASSSSTSSGGNLIAIIFTVIFFAMMILQGCHSSHGNKSSVSSHGSLDLSKVEEQRLLANGVPLTSVGSPNNMQPVSGSDIAKGRAVKSVH